MGRSWPLSIGPGTCAAACDRCLALPPASLGPGGRGHRARHRRRFLSHRCSHSPSRTCSEGRHNDTGQGLSSRVDWWGAAIPVWRTSPLLGRGLTGTRFEVLEPLGEDTTSSIHSTGSRHWLGRVLSAFHSYHLSAHAVHTRGAGGSPASRMERPSPVAHRSHGAKPHRRHDRELRLLRPRVPLACLVGRRMASMGSPIGSDAAAV
jgi:hypothetical protein